MNKIFFSFAAILLLFIYSGCEDTITPEEQADIDRDLIETYIAENNLSGYFLDEGIYIVMEKEGKGDENPDFLSTLDIIYTGSYLDGTVFDTSDGVPLSLGMSSLISGWQVGLQEFKEDSRGILLIPSREGYGPRGYASIPPNAVLRFDVQLLGWQ